MLEKYSQLPELRKERPFARLTREHDYLPATLMPAGSISSSVMPAFDRGIVWIVASLVVVTIALLALIPVDQVVTTRGIVVSKDGPIYVQPLDASIIKSIDVRAGDEVEAGQVLAQLDPTFASADLATLKDQVSSLDAQVARLKAETEQTPFEYSGNDQNWALQASIYRFRQAEREAKIQNYRDQIAVLASTMARSSFDVSTYKQRLNSAQSVEQMRKTLEAHGSGSRLNTLVASDARMEMSQSLANAEDAERAAGLKHAALSSELDAYTRGWHSDTAQQLSDASGKLNEAREQLKKTDLRLQHVELRSEKDAVVQSVTKSSVGSILQAGQQFITLIPKDTEYLVEMNIPGQSSGFVHIGDDVLIKFDTFAFSLYGTARGTVRNISPNSFNAQDETRIPTGAFAPSQFAVEPYFRGQASIDKIELHGLPNGVHLSPGMPVTADIKVGRRTVLAYLFSVVLSVTKEGMREP
jgi:hemolysin D